MGIVLANVMHNLSIVICEFVNVLNNYCFYTENMLGTKEIEKLLRRAFTLHTVIKGCGT